MNHEASRAVLDLNKYAQHPEYVDSLYQDYIRFPQVSLSRPSMPVRSLSVSSTTFSGSQLDLLNRLSL
jgi:hypothetical protein